MNKDKVKVSKNIDNNDCRSNYRKLCDGIPLFIKTIVLITFFLYILNFIIPHISLYLSNIPYQVIYKYQIWRICSTSLIITGFVNILFMILFWLKYASNLETAIGTVKYFMIFAMNSILIQIIYIILSLIISLILKDKNFLNKKLNIKGKVENCGIWPYIICELTLLSLSNPNYPIKFLFCPEFKTKYYPIFVLIIFCLVNSFSIDLEILCGIIYAFLYHFLIKTKLRISNNLVRKIENFGIVNCFKNFGGFISVNKNRYSSPGMSDNSQTVRSVTVNNNIPTLSVKDIISSNSITNTSDQVSQNETLDIKIQ